MSLRVSLKSILWITNSFRPTPSNLHLVGQLRSKNQMSSLVSPRSYRSLQSELFHKATGRQQEVSYSNPLTDETCKHAPLFGHEHLTSSHLFHIYCDQNRDHSCFRARKILRPKGILQRTSQGKVLHFLLCTSVRLRSCITNLHTNPGT